MSQDDLWRIGHLLDAIQSAFVLVTGRERADIDTDQMLQFALAHAHIDINNDILRAAVQVFLPELKQAHDACQVRAGTRIPPQNS
jgi:uncharacterized protein with HEPN domain